ncbi:GNAT domain-containing protein [Fusarium flagelliforme]|uniref:GNAT domain-containing protein n=1 Tax=Fusarium flagelliforme TaxID=2675880 RepID=UPI001E8E2413|nr:GNAT domain-containing protein [Fusarium flagelliforme]KAH7174993.1 GNAT domain-containing protein [Fusarium flagelliforme]
MAESQLHSPGFVQIRTTLTQLPYPPLEDRPTIITERLILKPFYEGAAEDLHPMRAQQEVMKWTSQGAPDKSIEETRQWTLPRLPPHHETDFSFVISLRETGEVIGAGGTYRRECELGWPGIGYAFRKEAWGKGYATEFLKAYMQAWWKLPRIESLIEVDRTTLSEEEMAASPEALITERCAAEAISDNAGSHRVLEKAGFEKVKEWRNEEKDWLIYGWVTAV